MLGVVAAGGGALENLGARGDDGLAHLRGDQCGELVGLASSRQASLRIQRARWLERDVGVGAEGVGGERDLLRAALRR